MHAHALSGMKWSKVAGSITEENVFFDAKLKKLLILLFFSYFFSFHKQVCFGIISLTIIIVCILIHMIARISIAFDAKSKHLRHTETHLLILKLDF